MQLKNIKHVSELPSWFELDKYRETSQLDALSWYEQLKTRNVLKFNIENRVSTNKEARDIDNELMELVHNSPVIDTTKNELLRIFIGIGEIELLKSNDYQTSLGVHMLTVRELYLYQHNIEDDKRVYAQNFFKQIFDGISKIKYLKYKCKDWIDQPVDDIRKNVDFHVNLNVDMGLPDKVLIEQFSLQLKTLRSHLKTFGISIENMQKVDFISWHKFGVLPYLDLILWAKSENIKIPNRVIADAIFPIGEGGEEVVRKTTKPLAFELISDHFLNKLRSLAAQHLAEKSKQ